MGSGCLLLTLFPVLAGLMPGLTLGTHSGQVSSLPVLQGAHDSLVQRHDNEVAALRDGCAKSVPLFLSQELLN